MFKFDEYPEIKKAYKENERLSRISYKLIDRVGPDKQGQKEADEAFGVSVNYLFNVFALKIFEVLNELFKNKKPILFNQYENRFEKWEKVFPEKWEDFNRDNKADILGLVMEIGYGAYWLPEEYYDDKPVDGCFYITCHTKPFEDF